MQKLPDFRRKQTQIDLQLNPWYFEKKLDKDNILPDDRYKVVAQLPLFGKNQEILKNWEIFKNN